MSVSFQESLEKTLQDYWEELHPGKALPDNFKAFISEATTEPPKKPALLPSGGRGARALANTSVGASMPIVSEVVGADQLFAQPMPPAQRVRVLNNKKKSDTAAGNESTGGRQLVPQSRPDPRATREVRVIELFLVSHFPLQASDRNPNPSNGGRGRSKSKADTGGSSNAVQVEKGSKAKTLGKPNARNDRGVLKETPPPRRPPTDPRVPRLLQARGGGKARCLRLMTPPDV
jgi:hypothetical protein